MRCRFAQWSAVLAVNLGLLLVTAMLGRPAVAQVGTGLPIGVQIDRNQAIANFPQGITFQFRARVGPGGPIFKQAELAYRLEGEVETSVRRQTFDQSDRLEAEFLIDTREEYFPPGSRISYYWLLVDEHGSIYETPRQELTYHDTRYNFQELKLGLLTVRWYQGQAEFGRAVLNKAQATINRLAQLYKIYPDRPINITIYPDSRTMFTALPLNTQEWVGGQAIPELGTVVLTLKPGDLRELGRSVPHEITHQVIYQATRNPYNMPPKWLDEGLAVQHQDQIDSFLQRAYQQSRDNHSLAPLRALNGAFPADSQLSFAAYGQSLEVVRYILQKYGERGIEKILAAFKSGVSYDEAVRAGLGISLDQLDADWKTSIGYAQPLPTVAPLSPDPTATTEVIIPLPTFQPEPTATPRLTLAPTEAVGSPGPQVAGLVGRTVKPNTPTALLQSTEPSARSLEINASPLEESQIGPFILLLAGAMGLLTIGLMRRKSKVPRL